MAKRLRRMHSFERFSKMYLSLFFCVFFCLSISLLLVFLRYCASVGSICLRVSSNFNLFALPVPLSVRFMLGLFSAIFRSLGSSWRLFCCILSSSCCKMSPSWFKMAQHSVKMSQHSAKMRQHSSTWPPNVSRWSARTSKNL